MTIRSHYDIFRMLCFIRLISLRAKKEETQTEIIAALSELAFVKLKSVFNVKCNALSSCRDAMVAASFFLNSKISGLREPLRACRNLI